MRVGHFGNLLRLHTPGHAIAFVPFLLPWGRWLLLAMLLSAGRWGAEDAVQRRFAAAQARRGSAPWQTQSITDGGSDDWVCPDSVDTFTMPQGQCQHDSTRSVMFTQQGAGLTPSESLAPKKIGSRLSTLPPRRGLCVGLTNLVRSFEIERRFREQLGTVQPFQQCRGDDLVASRIRV